MEMQTFSPENRLNELSAQEWLRFTKTWFIHNPSKRKKNELLHPAKYPEVLIEEFIRFFTKEGQLVFDPFLGTGSTLVAAHNTKRNGIGIELQQKYADMAQGRIKVLEESSPSEKNKQVVITGNSLEVVKIWKKQHFPKIDFVITSPPYGPMLNKKGMASKIREEKGLDIKYSNDGADLGNAKSYEDFLMRVTTIFKTIKPHLKDEAYLVVILQNYMDKGEYKMLAWDFAREMNQHFQFRGERIWCQDNKTLYPYGYRYSFVPNVHHHYCLIFKKVGKNYLPKVTNSATKSLSH